MFPVIVQGAQFLDKIRGVVASVGAEGDRAGALGDVLDHLEGDKPFGMTRDPGQSGIDNQTRAVLHQPVANKAEFCLHARPLAIEPRVGIGGTAMRFHSSASDL